MSAAGQYSMVHTEVVAAPADVLYGLVADVTRWPVIFGPSLYVRHLERGERSERFQLWALVNDEVKTWTSRRELDAQRLRITFEQERSQPPIASMGGEWTFTPLSDGRTEVVLGHHFSAVAGADAGWISRAVDSNSQQELASLRRIAELGHPVDEVIYTFSDAMDVPGAAADAYDFVNRSDKWPERLPHVSRVTLTEEVPGVQDMEMDTVTVDGSAHTTRSVRLCFPDERIVYKQLIAPALLFGHSGAWHFADAPDSDSTAARAAVVTARHTVAINPAAVAEVLGPDATMADARKYLRDALGGNGRATMAHAGAYAESRQAVPVDDGASG
jgi:aromatase